MTSSDVIATERILVDTSSERLGRELLLRFDDIHRRRVAPVLEQVMDEVRVPGLRIRLDKLVVDLGTLPATGLEEALTNRLRDELRRALAAAVRAARDDPSPDACVQLEGEAELDLLEQYLRRGSLPLWATDPDAFSLEVRLKAEIDRGPAGLVQLLQRLRGCSEALRRLALQLRDPALASLLHVLDPASAALILAYRIDLCALHREQPVIPHSEASYSEVLWVLVLSYVLHDPGSQFNRKSFVRTLLEGLADSEGIEYRGLLESLGRGLLATASHLPWRSSLPAVIGEILAEAEGHDSAPRACTDAVADDAAAAPSRCFARWFSGDPERILRLLRRSGADTRLLRQIVRGLDDDALRSLVSTLAPANATAVFDVLRDLRQAHRNHPLVAMGDDTFRLWLWLLVLTLVLRDPRSTLHEEQFVRSLLAELSAATGGAYHGVLAALRIGVADIASPGAWRSCVPYFVGEPPFAVDRPPSQDAGSLRTPWDALREALLFGTRPAPVGVDIPPSLAALLRTLLKRERERVGRLVRLYGAGRAAMERIVRELDGDTLGALLRTLEPESAAEIIEYLEEIHEVHRAVPEVALGVEVLDRRLWSLSLSYVLHDPGSQFNRKSFVRSLIMGLASAEGVEYLGLLMALRLGLQSVAGRRMPASSLPAIVAELLADHDRREASDRPSEATGGNDDQTMSRPQRPTLAPLEQDLADNLLELIEALDPDDAATLVELARAVLDAPRGESSLARRLADPRTRDRWVELMPDSALHRLAAVLAPRNHQTLIAAAELLHAAWSTARPSGHAVTWSRATFWSALLEILSQHAGKELSVERLTLDLFEQLASRTSPSDKTSAQALGQHLIGAAERLANDAGNRSLVAVLDRSRVALLARWPGTDRSASIPTRIDPALAGGTSAASRNRPSTPRKSPKSTSLPASREESGLQTIFLDNAGLVLTGPFLPHLFNTLDMLAPDDTGVPRLRDRETASRAVHIIQSLVNGRTDTPEPLLFFPKILCGLPTDVPVAKEIALTDAERAITERLLSAIITHWTAISNTSIAGLRETFLRREGKLTRGEDRWTLLVQRRTLDVLVDRIPWSISVLYHPWMLYPIHTTW